MTFEISVQFFDNFWSGRSKRLLNSSLQKWCFLLILLYWNQFYSTFTAKVLESKVKRLKNSSPVSWLSSFLTIKFDCTSKCHNRSFLHILNNMLRQNQDNNLKYRNVHFLLGYEAFLKHFPVDSSPRRNCWFKKQQTRQLAYIIDFFCSQFS